MAPYRAPLRGPRRTQGRTPLFFVDMESVPLRGRLNRGRSITQGRGWSRVKVSPDGVIAGPKTSCVPSGSFVPS